VAVMINAIRGVFLGSAGLQKPELLGIDRTCFLLLVPQTNDRISSTLLNIYCIILA